MNPLVKKEIRLLLPSWIVAVLLAMVQGVTRPYDFYVASLLFFGLTLMALTTIGREASLNTFSSLLLAQPAERIRLWQTKLSVLAVGFLTVFVVWLAAFGIAFGNSHVDVSDRENSYNLFITVCLIATATFTGGLWTTLLLRQIAGAFWLTLLVPATLSSFSGIFLADSESGNLVIAVLSVVIGVYSLAGFLFARWLFFRAQDIGWSGGVIAMPEWKFLSARAERAGSVRTRKPLFALVKKEFQLQQVSLMGAVGLLVLHAGMIALRTFHHFATDSAGAVLTAIFWILWVVLAPLVGGMAVAEERRLGVMEGQMCLPVSRRVQFVIKAVLTLLLGTFLGGVMPMLVEDAGVALGAPAMFEAARHGQENAILTLQLGVVAFAAWLTLVSFFASSLAKNFLQAAGLGAATLVGCVLLIPLFANGRILLLDTLVGSRLLLLILAVPTIILTLLWLAWLNFNHVRDGWPLARRNVGGIIAALLFIFAASNALYYRAWEVFEPAEPAHGPAKFSLANPPRLDNESFEDLLVRLPDGRVWFDYLEPAPSFRIHWRNLWRLVNPLPHSAGPRQFLSGSNWVSAIAPHVVLAVGTDEQGSRPSKFIYAYADSVGIQADGSLWVSDRPDQRAWNGGKLTRFGAATNWQQVVRSYGISSVLLLKRDGTLWLWGTNFWNWTGWPENWPGLRAFQPRQIGTDSDWTRLYWLNGLLARKADGTVWHIYGPDKNGRDRLVRATNYDQVVTQNFCRGGFADWGAYVRHDGSLWLFGKLRGDDREPAFEILRSGQETNWVAVARDWNWMVAIKNDGTLWQWPWHDRRTVAQDCTAPPTRLGIHHDWVAVVAVEGGIVSLAADGSLWFWPGPNYYAYGQILMRLPKQPRYLGNVLNPAD